MFLRSTSRKKNGKTHVYWGVVEADQTEVPFRVGDAFFEPETQAKSSLPAPPRSSTARLAGLGPDAKGANISIRDPVACVWP